MEKASLGVLGLRRDCDRKAGQVRKTARRLAAAPVQGGVAVCWNRASPNSNTGLQEQLTGVVPPLTSNAASNQRRRPSALLRSRCVTARCQAENLTKPHFVPVHWRSREEHHSTVRIKQDCGIRVAGAAAVCILHKLLVVYVRHNNR